MHRHAGRRSRLLHEPSRGRRLFDDPTVAGSRPPSRRDRRSRWLAPAIARRRLAAVRTDAGEADAGPSSWPTGCRTYARARAIGATWSSAPPSAPDPLPQPRASRRRGADRRRRGLAPGSPAGRRAGPQAGRDRALAVGDHVRLRVPLGHGHRPVDGHGRRASFTVRRGRGRSRRRAVCRNGPSPERRNVDLNVPTATARARHPAVPRSTTRSLLFSGSLAATAWPPPRPSPRRRAPCTLRRESVVPSRSVPRGGAREPMTDASSLTRIHDRHRPPSNERRSRRRSGLYRLLAELRAGLPTGARRPQGSRPRRRDAPAVGSPSLRALHSAKVDVPRRGRGRCGRAVGPPPHH